MDLESQLSQARADIARIKREKEEVSSRCVGPLVQVSSRLTLGLVVGALLILTADCTSVRIHLQFDGDFMLCAYRIKSTVLFRVVFVVGGGFVVVLVVCLFCFVGFMFCLFSCVFVFVKL